MVLLRVPVLIDRIILDPMQTTFMDMVFGGRNVVTVFRIYSMKEANICL